MALRVRIPNSQTGHPVRSRILLGLFVVILAVAAVGASVFAYFYVKYEGIVDARLKQPIFANTAQIYAAPREVRPDKNSLCAGRQRIARSRLHGRRRLAAFAIGHV